jgi:F-box-like
MLRFRLSWRDFFTLQKPVQAPALLPGTFTVGPTVPQPVVQLVPPPPRATLKSLPEELLEHVFNLFEGDSDSLKSCTLVCSNWRILCQPKLFHLLVLSTEDVAQVTQFQRFILHSAHIRAAVQQVEVHFSETWDRNVCNLMADILELLPRPESLKLYGPRYQGRIRWKRLPQHLNNSIRTVLRRPTLTTFLIDGWMLDLHMDELNALFIQCPSIFCNLSLMEVSDGLWGTMKIPLDTTHHGRLVLKELTISNTFAKDPKLIDWLCQPESTLDLQSLKTLRIMESRDDAAVETLLITTGDCLQNLELNISMSSFHSLVE